MDCLRGLDSGFVGIGTDRCQVRHFLACCKGFHRHGQFMVPEAVKGSGNPGGNRPYREHVKIHELGIVK